MSDLPQNNQDPHHQTGGRQPASRPPIQWPVRADNAQTERERAAQLARQRVEHAYTGATGAAHDSQPQTTSHRPVERHHTMRTQAYDWQQYHTAWQQYYHQYFYRYYAGWWQQQKLQQTTTQSSQPAPTDPETKPLSRQTVSTEIRQKIRGSVEKQTKKIKSSSHFKPILAAVSVGAFFLLANYNQVIVGAVKQYVAPGSVVTTPVIVEPNAQASVGPEPKIIIPKIGVESPVVYDEPRVDEGSYQAALERGVVRLGTTANPGTKGNVVIGGHSSNNVFNAGKYKYVFVNLKRLEVGDIFYLNYQGTRYTYKVTVAHKIITPTDTSVLAPTEKPTVTLFTCDPPGTNVNRLIVQAQQIDPNPEAAVANTQRTTGVDKNNPLPSVAPSLWDRIFSF